ncbi:hypothetical protein Psal003_00511 [Piscirickettsia salmonis]|nr:hypothetical protein Psal003_00511 [Piscirickettsia salmonis]QGN86998.1 hypothetical protein Psal004_00510 [Piscirickettsia salmonis]
MPVLYLHLAVLNQNLFDLNYLFGKKHGTVAKNYSELQKGYFLVLATLELSS